MKTADPDQIKKDRNDAVRAYEFGRLRAMAADAAEIAASVHNGFMKLVPLRGTTNIEHLISIVEHTEALNEQARRCLDGIKGHILAMRALTP